MRAELAELYRLDLIVLPLLTKAVGQDVSDVSPAWRPASLQEVTEVLDELAQAPTTGRTPVVRRLRRRLNLVEKLRSTVDDAGTLAAVLDAEADLWSIVLDAVKKEQLDHLRTSYVPFWSNQHQSVLDRMADRRERLRKDTAAAKELRLNLERREIATDEDFLRQEYENRPSSK